MPVRAARIAVVFMLDGRAGWWFVLAVFVHFAAEEEKTNVFCGLDGERRIVLGLPFSTFAGCLVYLIDQAGNEPPPA